MVSKWLNLNFIKTALPAFATTTGTKVIDTWSLIQQANGAHLDTKNNILTMPGAASSIRHAIDDFSDGLKARIAIGGAKTIGSAKVQN